MSKRRITVAHSPDTDDVFMFWAVATRRLDTEDREYALLAKDIEVLNREALSQVYDVTAISYGAYPYCAHYYALLDSGGSIGEGYGPVLVAREPLELQALAGRPIAIPGRLTTAFLVARLALPEFQPLEVPFKDVGEAVLEGRVAAGLLIHEGQLTWREQGLHKILDLGEWWRVKEGLPLPLGGNAISRDLERPLRLAIARDLRRSIEMARAHPDEALAYAMALAPGLDREGAERYIAMYVNDETVRASDEVRRAVRVLFERGLEAGILPERVDVDFVDAE